MRTGIYKTIPNTENKKKTRNKTRKQNKRSFFQGGLF